jgi:hypothetical protein
LKCKTIKIVGTKPSFGKNLDFWNLKNNWLSQKWIHRKERHFTPWHDTVLYLRQVYCLYVWWKLFGAHLCQKCGYYCYVINEYVQNKLD